MINDAWVSIINTRWRNTTNKYATIAMPGSWKHNRWYCVLVLFLFGKLILGIWSDTSFSSTASQ